jgi:site-specific DNA-methyltransferase (adenine-specific)
MNWTDKIQVTCEDNMKLMSRYPDNYFDLAIVDPPYGLGFDGGKIGKGKELTKKSWDTKIPEKKYWDELFRISKNQIVWGANYMVKFLPASMGWCYWDKMQNKEGHRYGKTFASGELAFTSFDRPMEHFEYKYQGNYIGSPNNITTKTKQKQDLKIHPTQKPIALYKWLLNTYAEKGQKILDTHLGSGSIAIACHYMGFELTACEIDKEYYNDSYKRFKQQTAQLAIF